jgi:hypothetical protein
VAAKKGDPKPIATFEAYIPTIKSAILFGHDGAQVKLEIPGTDLEEALKLARDGQNKILQVVVFEAPTQ